MNYDGNHVLLIFFYPENCKFIAACFIFYGFSLIRILDCQSISKTGSEAQITRLHEFQRLKCVWRK